MPIYKKTKILLTGHKAFLGKRVLVRLRKDNANFFTSEIDFRNLSDTKELFKKERPEVVIHCDIDHGGIKYIAEHPGEIYFNNVLISLNLQEASRLFGVKKFINPISSSTYPGHLTGKMKEENWWDGPLHDSVLVIGMASKNSWAASYAYHKQYHLQYANLILPNLYGAGDCFDEVRSYAVGALVKRIMDAKKNNLPEITIWGTGKPIRDYVYIDDIVDAVIRAIEVDIGIEPINLGSGQGFSITELAEAIKEAAGYQGKFVYDTTKPEGALSKILDNTRCREILNWQPATSLKEGLKKTIESYLTFREETN